MTQGRRFLGRRALVTGASRGIGSAIAERLAAEGAQVAITARTLDEGGRLVGSLRTTAERLARYGSTVAVVDADLADEHARSTIVQRAAEALGGPVEILVNNAAGAIYDAVAAFPLRRRRLLFELNVHAPVDLAQAVIPGMREAGEGWIVNVSSSTAALVPGPPFDLGFSGATMTIYGATKAALNRVTNGLAIELHGAGIRVNSIQPRAAVLSEGADSLVGGRLRPDQIESMEEMVEGAVFLCDCPAELTGMIAVSLDLIAEHGLVVHGLDGRPLPTRT